MPEAVSQGVRIRYDVAGEGEPALLFLPGWCDNRSQFHKLAPLCAQKHRILSPDWRGHGQSEASSTDFGYRELLTDTAAVVEASGAHRVVPVTMAHGGWVGIGLRRRFGPRRIPRLVFLDWIVFDPPLHFLKALSSLQDPEHWKSTRAQLFSLWLLEAGRPITDYVHRTLGDYSFGMWARAGREIAAAYAREGNPLNALAALDPPTPSLHLYALPKDEAYRSAQEAFTQTHPWFQSRRLDGKTHFPPLETPEAVAAAIEEFLAT
ncbi:MAG TPA: alpha/beta hydrolase [Thermoanaerobaculia bacterium]|nr:alpha/beta hydrolase [Thermoanaerobaculia bacterium]